MTEFRVFSSLDPSSCLELAPAGWRDRLQDEGFDFRGAGSFELWGGPAPLGKMGGCLAGWFSMEEARLRGVWVEKGFAAFRKEGELLTLEKVEATVGRGRQAGLLRGAASYRTDTLEFAGRAETEFNPAALLPILGPAHAELVRSFSFKEAPPCAQLAVTGVVGQPNRFTLDAHLTGTNFTYHDAAASSFESTLSLSNGIMVMNPLRVFRPEGSAEGRLVFDFDNRLVDVDATSTADPYAVAQMIGPAVGTFLRHYRFEGPTRVVAKGRIDYGTYKRTDIEGSVTGESMGLQWVLADQCSFRVRAIGPKLEFTDVQGLMFGGAFSGTAAFDRIDQPTNIFYEITGAVKDVDFSLLAQALGTRETKPYEGQLSVTTTVTGILGEGRGKTVVGEGTVAVKMGRLFQVPLLGGLSQMLSRIYPGLGFLTQTDFRSSFKIRDGKVHSDDAYLEGSILSVSGQGSYTFDQKLNFNVQVQLLRESALASVVRLVTFPVTKLLEFHLGGTLQKPTWRPVNFPKELLLIFD
jgi:hypothetical protein